MADPTTVPPTAADAQARVGIVVRTKNRPWFLRRALADIAAQTFTSWRVQVVNDGGDSDEVDAAVATLPPDVRSRISLHHNPTPRGRSAAANDGLARLRAEFIVLHDDDDLWHPEFLDRTVAWLDEHTDDVGVSARTEIVYEVEDASGGGFSEVSRAPFWADMTEISYTDLLAINRVVPISFLYRRALHEEIGRYREDVHAAEDWEFYLRVAVVHRIAFLPGPPLAFWMQRRDLDGELGNSMFALAHEHGSYTRAIRDEALRAFAAEHGSGLPLYITAMVPDELRRIVREDMREMVREELARALDARPSDLQRIAARARRWLKRDGGR